MNTNQLHKLQTRGYGWKPDLPDVRDFKYKITGRTLPIATTNNRTNKVMPPVFDQGNLGSCTGNGCASVMNFLILNGLVQNKITGVSPVPLSRLFIYYNERVIEGTVNEDSGAQIRDGVKVLAKLGAPPEKSLPYDITKFAKKPSSTVYKKAAQFTALSYQRIDNSNLGQLVDCLQKGLPFVFGFSVYESFESDKVAKTGIVPMPKKTEQLLGGHCVWCVDYDAAKKGFWCINSWGSEWGLGGLFFMPQAYITNTNLADDFWTINLVK